MSYEAMPGQTGPVGGPLYYYTDQGSTAGPVTMAALAERAMSGWLRREDLVWAEGDPTSMIAGEVPELAHLFGQQPLSYQTPPKPAATFANFWQRFVAYIVDSVIVGVCNAIIGGVFGAVVGIAMSGSGNRNASVQIANAIGSLFGFVSAWLYGALMESSLKQATLGKMAMGLIVVDDQGNRLTFGRATGRHFGKYVSSLTLGIGFLMVLWTERKQALHDIMARTLVLKK